MGWLFVIVGIVGILFARRITQRVILLRVLAVFILLAGIVLTAPPEPTKTLSGAASPVAVPPPAPQLEPKLPRGIGRSYFQITAFPGVDLVEKVAVPLSDGRAHAMLVTPDNLAIVEVVGSPENPSLASIMIGIPNNNDVIIRRNTALALVFLGNIFPSWDGRVEWLERGFKRAVSSFESGGQTLEDQIDLSGNRVRISFLKPFSTVTISVSPAP